MTHRDTATIDGGGAANRITSVISRDNDPRNAERWSRAQKTMLIQLFERILTLSRRTRSAIRAVEAT